jgi:tripartite-type tricarboxylate transporter receptor subunit TctC
MLKRIARIASYGTLMAALPIAITATRADSVAEFYKGKTVTLVVAFGAGGMYGLNGRIMSRHIGKHIPGNPNIIVQHKSGAGGSKAANYMYSAAPKDGSYMAELSKDTAVAQVLRPKKLKYNAAKFQYLGRMMPYSAVFMVWHKAGIKSMLHATKKTVIIANSGVSSHSYLEGAALREWAGIKVKLVKGYRGAANMYKAMESGEVHARIGAWFSLKAKKPGWLRDGKVDIILQTGLTKAPDLPYTPQLIDFARNEEERKMATLLELGSPVGWGLSVPPGVSKAKVAALRGAFDKMLVDKDFIKDAYAKHSMVDGASGQFVQNAVNQALSADPRLVKKLRSLVGFK